MPGLLIWGIDTSWMVHLHLFRLNHMSSPNACRIYIWLYLCISVIGACSFLC
uniref:Uncharacterized protein n=1 Tax=Anguilla anguilla TaxID=7936 RepID=A0A0E9W1L4_ANGAN